MSRFSPHAYSNHPFARIAASANQMTRTAVATTRKHVAVAQNTLLRSRTSLLGGCFLCTALVWIFVRGIMLRYHPNLVGPVIGSKVCVLKPNGSEVAPQDVLQEPTRADRCSIKAIMSETLVPDWMESVQFEPDYVLVAKCLLDRLTKAQGQPQFLFVSMGNSAFVPFIQNWLCNTATMEGVHERTLFIFSDREGVELMQKNPFKPACVAIGDSRDRSEGNLDYLTYGYWRETQRRVHAVVKLIEHGIPLLLFEPDALWVDNPLLDPCLGTGADLVGFEDNGGVLGFGWLRVLPSPRVLALFRDMQGELDRSLQPFAGAALTATVPIAGEQDILYRLLQYRHWNWKPYASIRVERLAPSKYVSGKWYDGGRGGDGRGVRSMCKREGRPCVINNNWIVGNAAKIARARRWGHWFVQDAAAGACEDEERRLREMREMLRTMETLEPLHGAPPPDECPLC